MKGRVSRVAVLAVLAVCLSGCAALLVGAGAAGGYAVSRDSIKNTFDHSVSRLYQVSREVIGDLGFVTMEDERRGLIQATVQGVTVTVTVTPTSEHKTALEVKARNKLLMPKIKMAQDVYNRILDHL